MWLSLRTITGKVFLLCLFHFTALSQTILPGTVPGTIVYSRAGSPNGNVYFASGDGTREVAITEGEQPRLSPDGRFLLFHRDRAPYSQANMYVRDLSNSTQWELADGGSYIVGYDWNLAGDRVIFDYSCDIEIIDRSGANRGGFVSGDCYDDAPSLSRADGTVCFHNIHSGLWLSNANGSNKRFIPSTRPTMFGPFGRLMASGWRS